MCEKGGPSPHGPPDPFLESALLREQGLAPSARPPPRRSHYFASGIPILATSARKRGSDRTPSNCGSAFVKITSPPLSNAFRSASNPLSRSPSASKRSQSLCFARDRRVGSRAALKSPAL